MEINWSNGSKLAVRPNCHVLSWKAMHHSMATQARSLVSDSVTALVDNQVCSLHRFGIFSSAAAVCSLRPKDKKPD